MSAALLLVAFAVVALLYSAVGQAGGTGYIAVMGLAGFAPDVIRPTALALNILVALIACARFTAVGVLKWRSCYPFAVLGAPFSLLGGTIQLPAVAYQPIVGLLLLLAGLQLLLTASEATQHDAAAAHDPPFLPALAVGGAIGLVSGITGVGGGIFLAPVILALGWAGTRQTAAISATFNLLNSAAALAGVWATLDSLPAQLPTWLLAVAAGALVGTWLSTRVMTPFALRIVLALLLLSAGARMILTPYL